MSSKRSLDSDDDEKTENKKARRTAAAAGSDEKLEIWKEPRELCDLTVTLYDTRGGRVLAVAHLHKFAMTSLSKWAGWLKSTGDLTFCLREAAPFSQFEEFVSFIEDDTYDGHALADQSNMLNVHVTDKRLWYAAKTSTWIIRTARILDYMCMSGKLAEMGCRCKDALDDLTPREKIDVAIEFRWPHVAEWVAKELDTKDIWDLKKDPVLAAQVAPHLLKLWLASDRFQKNAGTRAHTAQGIIRAQLATYRFSVRAAECALGAA